MQVVRPQYVYSKPGRAPTPAAYHAPGRRVKKVNVREWFDYDPRTGELLWKYRSEMAFRRNSRVAGRPAGGRRGKEGYIRLQVEGRWYLAHRLVWEWVHGAPPERDLDHKNGRRYDNRIDNLRLATVSQNHQNKRATGKHPKGVCESRPGQFTAHIQYGGKQRHIGSFKTAEEAHEAYIREAKRVFGVFACWDRK